MNHTETLVTLILALVLLVAVLCYVIREATYSKNTKMNLEAMRKLLAEIALKQGVEISKVEGLESVFKSKDSFESTNQKALRERVKWD